MLGCGGRKALSFHKTAAVGPAYTTIQYVTGTITSGNASIDVTISSISTSLTSIMWGGQIGNSGGAASRAQSLVRAELINATTVRFTRGGTPSNTVECNVTLVTWSSSWVDTIQRGTIAIANPATSNTATITSVTTSRSYVSLLGFSSTDTTAIDLTQAPIVVLTNATTVTASVNTTDPATLTASYEVVQFKSAVVRSVQYAEYSGTAAALSQDITISAVTTADCMVIPNGQTIATDNRSLAFTSELLNTTTVRFTRGATTSTVSKVGVTVVELVSAFLAVENVSNAGYVTSSTTKDIPLAVPVDITKSFLTYQGFNTTANTNILSLYSDIKYKNASEATLTRQGTATLTAPNFKARSHSFAASATPLYVLSIQEFDINVGTGTSATATISSVNTAKAFILLTGCNAATSNMRQASQRCTLTNSTTVTATVGTAGTGNKVHGFVIECSTALVASIQYVASTLVTNATVTAAISAVTVANSIILDLGQSSNTNSSAWQTNIDNGWWNFNSSTQIQLNRHDTSAQTIVAHACVVEFNPSALAQNVQAVTVAQDTVLTASIDTTISAVTVSRTAVFSGAWGSSSNTALNHIGMELTSSTNLRMTKGSAAANSIDGTAYVVEFIAGVTTSIQTGKINFAASTSATGTGTLTAVTVAKSTISNLFWVGSLPAAALNTNLQFTATLTSTTVLTATRAATSAMTGDVYYQNIEWVV